MITYSIICLIMTYKKESNEMINMKYRMWFPWIMQGHGDYHIITEIIVKVLSLVLGSRFICTYYNLRNNSLIFLVNYENVFLPNSTPINPGADIVYL